MRSIEYKGDPYISSITIILVEVGYTVSSYFPTPILPDMHIEKYAAAMHRLRVVGSLIR